MKRKNYAVSSVILYDNGEGYDIFFNFCDGPAWVGEGTYKKAKATAKKLASLLNTTMEVDK